MSQTPHKGDVLTELQRDRLSEDGPYGRPPDCDRPLERRPSDEKDETAGIAQPREDAKPGSVIDAWCRF